MKTNSNDYFGTLTPGAELAGSAVTGGIWTVGTQIARFCFQLGSTVVLARYLLPEDFGVVALVLVLANFAGMLKDIGIARAVVRSSNISRYEASNLFWIGIFCGVAIATILWLLSDIIAGYFARNELIVLTKVFGIFIFIQCIGVLHRALAVRHMKFRELSIIDTLSPFFGALVGIFAAILGWGYWALVWQYGVAYIFSLIGCWLVIRWKPSLPRYNVSVVGYLKFGGSLSVFDVVNYVSRNFDNILIGRFLGADALGLYSKAYQLLALPMSQINQPICNVLIPVLSRLRDDQHRFTDFYMMGVSVAISITFPLICLCWLCSDDIIFIILGQAWMQASPVFSVLIPAVCVGALNIATTLIYQVLGRPNRQLIFTLWVTPIYILSMIVGLQWGLIGVAWAVSLSFCVIRLYFIFYSIRWTFISYYRFNLVVLQRISVCLLALPFAYYMMHMGVALVPLVRFILVSLSYGIAYLAVDFLLLRESGGIRMFKDFFRLTRRNK